MELLATIRSCTHCFNHLPHGPRPILQYSAQSSVVIIGQAPGIKAHETGKPWNDASGERLRSWLAIDENAFYDATKISLVPMGFCYPGRGKSGDLPPRPECVGLWHHQLLPTITHKNKLVLLVGNYAQDHYLAGKKKDTLTETVRSFRQYLPEYFVLPHPSPRNNIWLKKNEWFARDVLPSLKEAIQLALR